MNYNLSDADAYTLHITIAQDALHQAEFCRDNRALREARRWLDTARHNIREAAKCAAAMQAREAARQEGAS